MKTVILVLAAFACFAGGLSQKCGTNRVYSECGTACPKRCDNWNKPVACIKLCVRGCFCRSGFVLLGSVCVRIDHCPTDRTILPLPIIKRCGGNETLAVVDRICNTCDSVCVEPVKRGCTCQPNYVLNRVTGQCVLPQDCPQLQCNEQLICPPDEQVDRCKSPCEPTCNRPHPPDCPFLVCRVGCVCKPPLIRDDASGRCVKPENCLEPCGENAFRSLCASCPRTCQRPNPRICPAVCIPGCVCRAGYVMDENTKTCVRPDNCPSINIRSII